MILINLLPHREERRRRRKQAFFIGLGLAALGGAFVVGVWYLVLTEQVRSQQSRNEFLGSEIRRLEAQIKDIASLRNEIEARDPAKLEAATDRAEAAIAERHGRGSVAAKIQAHVIVAIV